MGALSHGLLVSTRPKKVGSPRELARKCWRFVLDVGLVLESLRVVGAKVTQFEPVFVR
jgi:hypothetical protein